MFFPDSPIVSLLQKLAAFRNPGSRLVKGLWFVFCHNHEQLVGSVKLLAL